MVIIINNNINIMIIFKDNINNMANIINRINIMVIIFNNDINIMVTIIRITIDKGIHVNTYFRVQLVICII